MMRNYGTPPVALVSGQGCRVTDADGREYLDLIAGIAVSSLGHAHPALVDRRLRAGRADRPHLEPVHQPAGGRPRRAAGRHLRAARRAGLPLQRRRRPPTRRPSRSRIRARPGPPPVRRRGGLVPRPDARRACADRQGRRSASRSGRSGSTSTSCRTTTRRRWRPPSTSAPRRSSSSRRSARPASYRRRRATSPRPARSATPPARCWSSTRCRAASAAPGAGSPTSTTASCRTS